MHLTNVMRRNNGESETKPKAHKSGKLKHILKPIWDENDLYTGNGIARSFSTINLPYGPMALVGGLDMLMVSKAAGNTGVRNE